MNNNEIIDRQICGDPRVFKAIQDARLTDNSFKEKGFLGFPIKYTQDECREFWFQAMDLGIKEGLRIGCVQLQRIDLFNNCTDPRQKEFLEKFYKLAEEYNCAIVYHPENGMCVMDLNRE